MLCDKDEAAKAKELAEKKFAEDDLNEAKRFALQAQNLYSELDGLHQLLLTLDVHIAVREGIHGVVDWYKVLGVEPLADDDTIRKYYKKLALMLHPDKNKSVGAQGAFQNLTDAWRLLSDKSKRIEYDQKWKGIYGQVPIQEPSPSVPSCENRVHKFDSGTNSNARDLKRPSSSRRSAPRRRSKPTTFWTACTTCKLDFEYRIDYLDVNVLCPCCHQPFLAKETSSPPLNGKKFSTEWSGFLRQQKLSQTTVDNALGRKSESSSVDLLQKTSQTDALFKQQNSSQTTADDFLEREQARP